MDKLAAILAVIEAVTKLVEQLRGLGIDFSGVKMHTSNPIDIGGLFHLIGGGSASSAVPGVPAPPR